MDTTKPIRQIHVRLDSEKDVIDLSKRMKINLTKVSYVSWSKGIPNLFNWEYTYHTRSNPSTRNIEWLDLSKYEWDDMPTYKSRLVLPYKYFLLETNIDSTELSEVFSQNISDKTKSVWFPKKEPQDLTKKAWNSTYKFKPKYPIYIISKDRADICKTAISLEWMGIDFKIVVEPNQEQEYRKNWGDRVLVGDFDTTTRSSIPVRNWVNEHCSVKKYWLMDDNILYFYILNSNQSFRCKTGAIFCMIEDFVDRYDNVALAGINKLGFCPPTQKTPPYLLNRRVYSCTLMSKEYNEDIKIDGQLWRGRYNEDTDLNIRFLKKDYCTMNFSMFLCDKRTIMTEKGGNTDTVYVDGDNRMAFAQSLVEQHPDVVSISKKWGRNHHHVDWDKFKNNKLKKKNAYQIRDYGLFLGEIDGI